MRSRDWQNVTCELFETFRLSAGGSWHTYEIGRHNLSIHFLVRFEPLPGKATKFRAELLRVLDPTRAETGCLGIHVFESLREPFVFAIHSEWVDEAAFELHARLPHTVRFLEAAKQFLSHPVEGLRSREITGGSGVGAT
jgi:quinol monooxygenase YgiN